MLTKPSFNEVQYDLNVDEGAVLYKLILRAFPNHFDGDSIYAHFPFVTPNENLMIQTSLSRSQKYSWNKPTRKPETIVVKSQGCNKEILFDKINWTMPKLCNILSLEQHHSPHTMLQVLGERDTMTADFLTEVKSFYEKTTREYLHTYSYTVPRTEFRQVDVVRDIANLVNTRFAAALFSLPIKTEDSPHGLYSAQELYHVLSVLFVATNCDSDVTKSFQIREVARTLAKQLGDLMVAHVEAVSSMGFISGFFEKVHWRTVEGRLASNGTLLIKKWMGSGLSAKEVVWRYVIPMAIEIATGQARMLSQAVDYHLGQGKSYVPELYRLAQEDSAESNDIIRR